MAVSPGSTQGVGGKRRSPQGGEAALRGALKFSGARPRDRLEPRPLKAPYKLRCACCGGWGEANLMGVWRYVRIGRRLLVNARERAGPDEGVAGDGLFVLREVAQTLTVCVYCREALEAGAPLHAVAGPAQARRVLAAAAAILLIYLASPLVLVALMVVHRGVVGAPPPSVLLDRTYKRFLDKDPTLPRTPPGYGDVLPKP